MRSFRASGREVRGRLGQRRRVGRLGLTVLAIFTAGCVDRSPPPPTTDASVDPGADPETEQPAPRLATIGLDSALIAAAFDSAAELPRLRCLVIARHGDILAERCFRGPGLDEYANVKSVSKSVVSALVGIAISEGHLAGSDQAIFPFFERYLAGDTASTKRRITIGNLLSMQSGLERTSGGNYGRWVTSPNWVRYAISRPLVAEPGSSRLYSTGNTHLLSAIVTDATGMSTWEYAREKLGEPLGIRLPRWPADPQGIYFGGNEMRLTPRDMVRFGELYRNLGEIDGRQVVPSRWVEESLVPRSRSRYTGESYGYGWFMAEARGYPMFYAWGYGGQYIFVIPDLELTVVTTSNPDDPRTRGHNDAIMDLVGELIVPAAELGSPPNSFTE
ncbi:MAG: serine hydrolase [Gemmatimonadota bacterium]